MMLIYEPDQDRANVNHHAKQTTRIQPFNGIFFRTNWVSQYQKNKTSVDIMKQNMMGFWDAAASAGPYANNLHHSRQTTTPAHRHSIFTSRMLFLTPNQQCQSTEGTYPAKHLGRNSIY